MKKKTFLTRIVAMCLTVLIGVTAFPISSFAKAPTIETTAEELTVGKNQLKFSDYYKTEGTLLGRFKVPETGKYTFQVTNNGELSCNCYLMNEDLAEVEAKFVYANNYEDYETYSLKKGEIYYFYVEEGRYSGEGLLAAKINIKKIEDSKPVLNKKAASVKEKKKITLKLKNNKKKVIWVSSDEEIATVSSKGVVTAKKEGTAYIYAIANDKLYKCKIAVYK